MCKQEMVGWFVGGVNTWQQFVAVSAITHHATPYYYTQVRIDIVVKANRISSFGPIFR